MSAIGDRARSATFPTTKVREGYRIGDVDGFLEKAAAAADAGEPLRRMVDVARFAPVRFRDGYDMAAVDSFLDEMVRLSEDETATGQPPPSAGIPSGTPPAVGAREAGSSAVVEEKGFLARLRGR